MEALGSPNNTANKETFTTLTANQKINKPLNSPILVSECLVIKCTKPRERNINKPNTTR